MNVEELIKKLQGVNPTTIVIMSSDAEGNSFHEIDMLDKSDNDELVIYPSHDSIEDMDNEIEFSDGEGSEFSTTTDEQLSSYRLDDKEEEEDIDEEKEE